MRNGFYLGLTLPLLLAMAVNAYGLTTFGKSQNTNVNQQPNPQQPVMRGRECTYEKDCVSIVNTSCVADPLDPKTTRCLCGDNKTPLNGACKAKHKGVNHACMTNDECMDGSECTVYKETGNRGVDKICKCSEGYTEIEFSCSGGARVSELSFPLISVLAASFTLLAAVATSAN